MIFFLFFPDKDSLWWSTLCAGGGAEFELLVAGAIHVQQWLSMGSPWDRECWFELSKNWNQRLTN